MKARLAVSLVLVFVLVAVGFVVNKPAPSVAVAKGPDLTVYSDGFALVVEQRTFALQRGLNTVRLSDVPRGIDPTSVHVRSLSDPQGTVVLEQTFIHDLVDPASLLERYTGEVVRVTTVDGTAYVGTLLAAAGDVVLRRSGGDLVVLSRAQVQTFELTSLPEGMVLRPTLEWLVEASQAGPHTFELAYLTEGLRWQAHYNARLAEDESRLDLVGWFTVENQTAVNFVDAHLKLVAGNVRREGAPPMRGAKAVPEVAAAPVVQEQPLFEYHVYTVERPVTLLHNRSKQVEFLIAQGIQARKQYVLEFAAAPYPSEPTAGPEYTTKRTAHPTVFVEFTTGKGTPVEAALPAGTIRVYKEDADGIPLFVGEAAIGHTPPGEVVKLAVGQAFDVVGERIQTSFSQLGSDVAEESYEIVVRNRKQEPITVRVVERMFRHAWEIVEASQEYTKADASTLYFDVQVPAEGETRVTYTVRYHE